MIKLKKGLDLPIGGAPEQSVVETIEVPKVALLGPDYLGMKPTMKVQVDDQVIKGQVLFTDKKMEDVQYTSPVAGRVLAINRGAKRAFLSIVISVEGKEEITFSSHKPSKLKGLKREAVVKQLLESGQWTALRTRPFSKVANPNETPHSIFVTAMDTNPLAPAIPKLVEGRDEDLQNGLKLIAKLTDGKVYLCKAPETNLETGKIDKLVVQDFSGPHPAGNVGTHIHFLDPVHRNKQVWYVGIQDVLAIGRLFKTGKLESERIVSLAGPPVKKPRLVRTVIGADLEALTSEQLQEGEQRIISGPVLSGRTAAGHLGFLGRFHQQVSVLKEDRERRLLGWLTPGANRHSIKNNVLSKIFKDNKLQFTTSTNGEPRPIVPSGSYQEVMPLDILPLFLLRALAVDDVESAVKLGVLELDEEDLALCAYVCPSKLEFGPMLRRNLTSIEKEG